MVFQEKNLLLAAMMSTAKASVYSSFLSGYGKKDEADGMAVKAMREVLNHEIDHVAEVVIGEGELDEAPMLYIGERLGKMANDPSVKPSVHIAVDPLEGTTLCANMMVGAVSVIGMASAGNMLKAPDVYMEKYAVGGKNLPYDVINPEDAIQKNIKNIAKAKGKPIEEVVVIVLERDRHKELIVKIRETGARVSLIPDGDVFGIIATMPEVNFADAYFGIGGAPEGVVSAAAFKAGNSGRMFCKMVYEDKTQLQRASVMLESFGIKDPNKIFTLDEIIKTDEVLFSASGVTDGLFLKAPKLIDKQKSLYRVNSMTVSSTFGFMNITQDVSFDK